MNDDISNLLKKNAPCLTMDLISALVENGYTAAAARKSIQRALGGYKRLAGVRFEKNARFIYLDEQYGDIRFWEKLEEAFYKAGKSYWSTIVSLKARGGIAPIDLFPRIAGTPQFRKRHLSPSIILERLLEINLLEEVRIGERDYISFKPHSFSIDDLALSRANELAEKIALSAVKDWARKIGFGSYNQFSIRYDVNPPVVSGVRWDITAPSYVRPLVSVRNGKAVSGFFVCDINLRDIIEKDEAEAFVRKCVSAAAPQKVGPIMPMIIGHAFAPDAFRLLKGKGILAVTLKNLFGKEIADALEELVQMLTDLGSSIAKNPDRLTTMMSRLSAIEGAVGNMRGALFELVIGSIVQDVEGGYLKTGEKVKDSKSNKSAEIDVQLDYFDKEEVLVIECKSKNPNARVSEVDIKKWYDNRVPLIYSILSKKNNYHGKHFHFEFWSNGQFTDSGLHWLKQQKTNMTGYTIGWKEGNALKIYARKLKNGYLMNTLNDHYFSSLH